MRRASIYLDGVEGGFGNLEKPVLEYPNYLVRPDGTVIRKSTRRIIAGTVSRRGYVRVKLHNDSGDRSLMLHRVVFEAFEHPIPDNMTINHIDGNKLNNRLSNLECVTMRENNIHAYKTGLRVQPLGVIRNRGSQNGNSVLTEDKVRCIKTALKNGVKAKELARQYSVAVSTVFGIKRGARWSHVVA